MRILSSNVTVGTFFDEHAVYFENDFLRAVLVPNWGNNLISLLDKRRNIEWLRAPLSKEQYLQNPLLYGNPVLFPPNRIEGGHFVFKGNPYNFGINEVDKNNFNHGLVYDKAWKLVRISKEDEDATVVTSFDSEDYPELTRQFPHHFVIQMTYSLRRNTLTNETQIRNLGSHEFPWGLGFHTSIPWPITSNEESPQGEILAPVGKRWLLNERNLPTGELVDTTQQIDTSRSLDDVFLVSKTGKNEPVVSNSGLTLKYTCDANFTQWVFYNGGTKSGFMCVEPYTWVTNAPNLDYPSSITGLQTLPPDETRVLQTDLTIL